jgi:SAM-dependent methyltransferase
MGYEPMHWTRVAAYRECEKRLRRMNLNSLRVLEISAGTHWQKMGFHSFKSMDFPEYDICSDVLDEKFDLIIADNVFEHLKWPYRAARNVRSMLTPGGTFMTLTPFLIRVHPIPTDCTRWTQEGLYYFLAESGFDQDNIETGSWGNRSCVKANLTLGPAGVLGLPEK